MFLPFLGYEMQLSGMVPQIVFVLIASKYLVAGIERSPRQRAA
jgi:hypothetical protein